MAVMEITTEGWLAIITAIGGLVTIAGTQIVLIIKASRTDQKLDAAAARREEIKDELTQ